MVIDRFFSLFSKDMAIDLGTANTLVYVKGEGVIGEQPDIKPGEEFQYTSGTMIETSLGTMKGSYHMIDDDDKYFDAIIPEFVLSVPRVIH